MPKVAADKKSIQAKAPAKTKEKTKEKSKKEVAAKESSRVPKLNEKNIAVLSVMMKKKNATSADLNAAIDATRGKGTDRLEKLGYITRIKLEGEAGRGLVHNITAEGRKALEQARKLKK